MVIVEIVARAAIGHHVDGGRKGRRDRKGGTGRRGAENVGEDNAAGNWDVFTGFRHVQQQVSSFISFLLNGLSLLHIFSVTFRLPVALPCPYILTIDIFFIVILFCRFHLSCIIHLLFLIIIFFSSLLRTLLSILSRVSDTVHVADSYDMVGLNALVGDFCLKAERKKPLNILAYFSRALQSGLIYIFFIYFSFTRGSGMLKCPKYTFSLTFSWMIICSILVLCAQEK